MDGDAGLAVFELFDPDDLRDVFAIHGIVGRGIRERDENTHTGIIGFEARSEVNAAF